MKCPCKDCIIFAICNTKMATYSSQKDMYFLTRSCTIIYDWLYGRDVKKELFRGRMDLVIKTYGGNIDDYYLTSQQYSTYNEYSI